MLQSQLMFLMSKGKGVKISMARRMSQRRYRSAGADFGFWILDFGGKISLFGAACGACVRLLIKAKSYLQCDHGILFSPARSTTYDTSNRFYPSLKLRSLQPNLRRTLLCQFQHQRPPR